MRPNRPIKRFPVLWPHRREEVELYVRLGCPRWVPWERVAGHEKRALRNHDQTLARLAERGGLAPCELAAVVEDRRWRSMPDEEAVARVLDLVMQRVVVFQIGGRLTRCYPDDGETFEDVLVALDVLGAEKAWGWSIRLDVEPIDRPWRSR